MLIFILRLFAVAVLALVACHPTSKPTPPADPTCSDGIKNGTETDVDCGGSCAPCTVGRACAKGDDCTTRLCGNGRCQPTARCVDGVKNGEETDIDCGGSCAGCPSGKVCAEARDCVSGVCTNSICQAPTCTDAVRNGTETDTDCGGGTCEGCKNGFACVVGKDCTSGVCEASKCQVPTCSDGVKNGSETGVDCGGSCQLCLPPDPASVASAMDPTGITGLAESSAFLYTGPNAIQTGVDLTKMVPARTCVLRGRVSAVDGSALPAVLVTVLGHPEFGSTMSRKDGQFDLVVNGGGDVTLHYSHSGYIDVQRTVYAPWQDYAPVPPAMLTAFDTQVTTVAPNASTMQSASGSMVKDGDGTRQATLLFAPGTQAGMEMPDGTSRPLTDLHVRATEFTVGTNGEKAMPGPLPATSAYTYAVELSADEAVAAGAVGVTFNQPVILYVDNFLGFPTGTAVPEGYYDRAKATWVATDNGMVVKILSIDAGAAQLDLDGSGNAASVAALAAHGITPAEQQQLAAKYATGASLWRVPVVHFSGYDSNWGIYPPDGARAAKMRAAENKNTPCGGEVSGSIINCANQTLGEALNLVGTPFSLHYQSNRAAGATAAASLEIPLTNVLPNDITGVELEIAIAGKIINQHFSPAPNLSTTFAWDGKDAYGRAVQGRATATIRIGYTYKGVYSGVNRFGYNGNGIRITGVRSRSDLTLWQQYRTQVGAIDARAAVGLGGWTLSAQHVYDPIGHTLYLGNGSERSANALNDTITTIAGTGGSCKPACQDGLPALGAPIHDPRSMVFGPDGSLYFLTLYNGHNAVRKIDPKGILTTLTDLNESNAPSWNGSNADGIPATKASIFTARSLAIGPDGSLYFAQPILDKVRRIAPDGIITTVAGSGIKGFGGDGGPATKAQLYEPSAVAVARDGTLYFSDRNNRIRRVGTDGIISTVVGNGDAVSCCSCNYREECARGVGGLATNAVLGGLGVMAIDPNGTLYFQSGRQVLRLMPNGNLESAVGAGACCRAGNNTDDGASALDANADEITSLAFDSDGRLFGGMLFNGKSAVRQITTDGSIASLTAIADDYTGDGGPAITAAVNQPRGVAFGPDGALYIADQNNNRIRKIASPLPGIGAAELIVPSEDGGEYYRFDDRGRHRSTTNTLTGVVEITFGYDKAGYLVSVTDKYGNVTSVQRDSSGNPTAIIGPYGQRTPLSFDSNGYLATVADPTGNMVKLKTDGAGLLTSLTDPNGNLHSFYYDSFGRLIKDADPLGAQTLARTDSLLNAGADFSVVRTSAMGLTETHASATLPGGGRQTITTDSDGTKSVVDFANQGTRTSTSANGVRKTATMAGSPVFGGQAPAVSSLTSTTPGGLHFVASEQIVVTRANADSPLSIATLADTVTINGRSSNTFFSGSTKLITRTSPKGRIASTVSDALGNVVEINGPSEAPVKRTYDGNGRLTSQTQGSEADARSASWVYGSDGYLANATDSLGQTVSITRDGTGRITKLSGPGNQMASYTYDPNGNVTSLTPPGKQSQHLFSYSNTNLLTKYSFPTDDGSLSILREYDADQRLARLTRADGTVTGYFYDNAGRLSSITFDSAEKAFTYDQTGQLASVTAPGGETVSFAYDGDVLTGTVYAGVAPGSVHAIFNNDFWMTSIQLNGATIADYSYDDDGLVMQSGALAIKREEASGRVTGTTLGVLSTSVAYNTFGEAMDYVAKASGSELLNLHFVKDKAGRIIQKIETIASEKHIYDYVYDAAGRLSGVTRDGTAKAGFSYDDSGNRLGSKYDAQDRLLSDATATYRYSTNGDLQTRTDSTVTTTYGYDAFGNLTSVEKTDGTPKIEYLINAVGERVGKKKNGVLAQRLVYQSGLEPIAELDGAGNVVSTFIYSSSDTNVPDYFVRGGLAYALVTDHLGSPRLVVNSATGEIVQRMDYDAFGNVILDTNPGFQPFGFAGGLYDSDTSLVHFGAREYDPRIGRWTQKDPMGFMGGTNVYVYSGNDPLNGKDPSGLDAVTDYGNIGDFVSGWGDTLSFGASGYLRRTVASAWFGPCVGDTANTSSSWYYGGMAIGTAHGLLLGKGAGGGSTRLALGGGGAAGKQKALAKLIDKAAKIDDGGFHFVIHGSNKSFGRAAQVIEGNWAFNRTVEKSAANVVQMIKDAGWNGSDPIRLLTCGAGKYANGLAQEIATATKTPVIAATDIITAELSKAGELLLTVKNGGGWLIFPP